MLSRACYNFFMNALLRVTISPVLIALIATSVLSFSYAHAQAQSSSQQSSETEDSNAFIIALAAAGLTTLAVIIATHAAQEVVTPSFGGKTTVVTPPGVCNFPPAIMATVVGPKPMQAMYLPSTLSYSYGPPVIPGQNQLGRVGITPVTCVTSIVPPIAAGFGFPVTFHGSSLPSPL